MYPWPTTAVSYTFVTWIIPTMSCYMYVYVTLRSKILINYETNIFLIWFYTVKLSAWNYLLFLKQFYSSFHSLSKFPWKSDNCFSSITRNQWYFILNKYVYNIIICCLAWFWLTQKLFQFCNNLLHFLMRCYLCQHEIIYIYFTA